MEKRKTKEDWPCPGKMGDEKRWLGGSASRIDGIPYGVCGVWMDYYAGRE
jgi:hypothetical protein